MAVIMVDTAAQLDITLDTTELLLGPTLDATLVFTALGTTVLTFTAVVLESIS
jgi:hypothetical protein